MGVLLSIKSLVLTEKSRIDGGEASYKLIKDFYFGYVHGIIIILKSH